MGSVTSPHRPYYGPDPYERQPHSGRRFSTADVVTTIFLWIAAVIAVPIAVFLSLFFGFAADSCPGACPAVPYHADEWIYPVTWGGIGFAFAVGLAGTLVAVWRRWHLWIWPAAALVIIAAAFFGGVALTVYSEDYWQSL